MHLTICVLNFQNQSLTLAGHVFLKYILFKLLGLQVWLSMFESFNNNNNKNVCRMQKAFITHNCSHNVNSGTAIKGSKARDISLNHSPLFETRLLVYTRLSNYGLPWHNLKRLAVSQRLTSWIWRLLKYLNHHSFHNQAYPFPSLKTFLKPFVIWKFHKPPAKF